jgi:soluble lytic murein transglycosylase-like protein
MPTKKRKIVNGALLGAAATALTVKGALAGPAGVAAQQPLHDAGKTLGQAAGAALDGSGHALDRAQAELVRAVVGVGPVANPDARSALSAARRSPAAPALPSTSGPSPHNAQPPDVRHGAGEVAERRFILKLLRDAATRHGVDPRLILALSYWESGWDQSRVSVTGAVGLMQVEPATAQDAGPSLLGRTVDITDPYDNADVGVAVFREDLDSFSSPAMALAAYYQGPTSLRQYGMRPDTQQYVEGILDLASRFSS